MLNYFYDNNRVSKISFFNTNLHQRFFQQKLPVYPESKRRSVASIEEQRFLPINLRDSPKGFKLYEESFKKPTHDHLLQNSSSRTKVSELFFSQENVNELQKMLRFMVYDQTGLIVDRQTDDDMLIIMRSMYLQYCTFPISCDKKVLQREVDRLNLYVLRDAVPTVISEAKMFMSYLRDASLIPAPIPRGLNVSNVGTRELRAVTDVLAGPQRPSENSYGFTQSLANQGY